MKTIDELFPDDCSGRMFKKQEIKDLLLEAWKQGMTDAADIADCIAPAKEIRSKRDSL